MDLILISDEKLKIILSENDMKRLNIDVESLDYSNVTTKKVFWEILDEAKAKAGFNADKSKLFVQVFPCGDGGCEMFVTKFSGILPQNNTIGKKKTYKIASNKAESGVFILLGFDELCLLCRRISKDRLPLSTTLYYAPSGKYILIIDKSKKAPSYIQSKNNHILEIPEYISEYGDVRKLSERFLGYADEHFKKIADGNAAEILSGV